MGAFWVTYGLSLTGCPSINPNILEFFTDSDSITDDCPFRLNTAAWPIIASPYRPLGASNRALQLTYDPRFLKVCYLRLFPQSLS